MGYFVTSLAAANLRGAGINPLVWPSRYASRFETTTLGVPRWRERRKEKVQHWRVDHRLHIGPATGVPSSGWSGKCSRDISVGTTPSPMSATYVAKYHTATCTPDTGPPSTANWAGETSCRFGAEDAPPMPSDTVGGSPARRLPQGLLATS